MGSMPLQAALENRRVRVAASVLVAGVYLALALWVSLAKQPWSDEGSFASPAYNLAFHGFMGTTIVDEGSSGLTGINAHTYWNAPLGIVIQALFFKLLGFHLVVMRLPSILMGLVAGLSWFVILRRLTGRTWLPVAAMGLILCDYTFLMAASLARYDMMSAGFGAAGLALYLALRERSLPAALLAGNAAVVAAGLTHPLGIVYLLGLGLLAFRDRRRLDLRSLALAATPFLAGGLAWGLYILEDPASFALQFQANLVVGDRGSGLTLAHPLATLWSELDGRYLRAFGLKEHSPGNQGPIYLKAFVLAVYFAAAIGALAVRRVRAQPGFATLGGLFALVFLFLTFGEGQRGAVYLVHVMPLFACLLAFAAADLLARRRPWPWIAGAALAVFLALQLGGTALRAAQDTYGRRYAPPMAYVRTHAGAGELVMGSVAAAFGVGLDRWFVADNRLGYTSGLEPDWIVVDDFLRESFAEDRARRPDAFRHIQVVLAGHEKVYDRDGTEVYAPRRAARGVVTAR
jgi:4-amino-4-deoxy-L-arabinose transferase-like glycosyltransferase